MLRGFGATPFGVALGFRVEPAGFIVLLLTGSSGSLWGWAAASHAASE
jgi:hypothetical protein